MGPHGHPEAVRPLAGASPIRSRICPQWFIDMTLEAFVQGGRAAAMEAGLYRRPWGFDPAQVKVETHLWYSRADQTVPASADRWLADRMQDTAIVVWPQHGHLSWMVADEAADVIATALS